MADFSETTLEPEFYSPWPLFGKRFSSQLGESRSNFESLHPVIRAAGFDSTYTALRTAAVQSWEIGEQDFHNKYRIFWDKDRSSFRIQENTGTSGGPVWTDRMVVSNSGGISGDFYVPTENLPPSSGGGETNTGTSLGGDEDIFAQKSGVQLQFKGLTAGSNISLSSDANSVTINSTASGGGGGFYGIVIKESDESYVTRDDTIVFDSSDFDITDVNGKPNITVPRLDGIGPGFYGSQVRWVGPTGVERGEFGGIKTFTFDGNFYITQAKSGTKPHEAIINIRAISGGGGGGVTDHGDLTGLLDDDHPQYYKNGDIIVGEAFYLVTGQNIYSLGDSSKNIIEINGSGNNPAIRVTSPIEQSFGSGATSGIRFSEIRNNAVKDIFRIFSGPGGSAEISGTKNFHIYEPGTLGDPDDGSNANRFLIMGPGTDKSGFGASTPVNAQLVLHRDGKISIGLGDLDYTNYKYWVTSYGSIAAPSFYLTQHTGDVEIPAGVLFDDSLNKYRSFDLKFNDQDFYLSRNSGGHPVLNAGASTLKFSSLVAGSNITLTQSADKITIASTGGGTTIDPSSTITAAGFYLGAGANGLGHDLTESHIPFDIPLPNSGENYFLDSFVPQDYIIDDVKIACLSGSGIIGFYIMSSTEVRPGGIGIAGLDPFYVAPILRQATANSANIMNVDDSLVMSVLQNSNMSNLRGRLKIRLSG